MTVPNCPSGDCCGDMDELLSTGLSSCWPAARIQTESIFKTLLSSICNESASAFVLPDGTLPEDFRELGWPTGLPSTSSDPYLIVVVDGDIWIAPNDTTEDIGTMPSTPGTGTKWLNLNSIEDLPLASYQLAQGRLTLSSNTPVPSSDVLAATTLYYTPYEGNIITLYNGTRSQDYTFSQLSISLAGLLANTNYDVYCYPNAGNPTLELLAWSSLTAQASVPVRYDGYWVRPGNTSRRWLGTIGIGSTVGQCEDSQLNRHCWNLHNQVERSLYVYDSTASWAVAVVNRPWNNNTANRVSFVRGLNEKPVELDFRATVNPTVGGHANIGISLDATTFQVREQGYAPHLTGYQFAQAVYHDRPAIGRHYLQLIEYTTNAGATTYYGLYSGVARSAAIGKVWA